MVLAGSNLYAAHPLDPTKQNIRTLLLCPGTDGQQIFLEIQVTDLDVPSPDYIALSYVWGVSIALEKVSLAGQEIPVTENLLSCLRHLRHRDDALKIWVDAICINQNDLEEKSNQVAMMGYIYSRCLAVYCWLGAPTDPMAAEVDPFQILRHFAEDKHYHQLPGFSVDEETFVRFEENHEFTSNWRGFLAVAESPYWTRSWTVQELILPNASVVCYGYWRISFETLILARRLRNAHLWHREDHCCDKSYQAFPASFKKPFDIFLGQVEWIERFRQIHLPEDHPLSSKGQPRTYPDIDYRPFSELQVTFSHRLCSEPRDKVFSLLAMAETANLRNYRPDYTKDLNTTYQEAFQLMLEELENDFRCMIGPTFASQNPRLPSWVPDLSHHTPIGDVEFILRRILLSSLYKASDKQIGTFGQGHASELHVAGFQADTVATIGPLLELDSTSLPRVLADWRALCENVMGSSADNDAIRTLMSRVMCASTVDDGTPLYGHYRGWRRYRATDTPSP
ncbi:hypothetical protein PFICI_07019 [Pestalotiopsis fici W106-1]|uniref:Heterokaryon incompatibility domain-containing protein n=1 Tax=Pestalotiopsis fici (strain W106-1 / CGMCC3.15140) TaxID=1229662 RepID=W3X9D5_PESFW|nr:uncharacterized protein PFICI_07019 [Pestalotiopsis fici W106-1]ETS82017.1 hypothetical protein PFICI_07019 [Pestalotiopsis fici W106-1]